MKLLFQLWQENNIISANWPFNFVCESYFLNTGILTRLLFKVSIPKTYLINSNLNSSVFSEYILTTVSIEPIVKDTVTICSTSCWILDLSQKNILKKSLEWETSGKQIEKYISHLGHTAPIIRNSHHYSLNKNI